MTNSALEFRNKVQITVQTLLTCGKSKSSKAKLKFISLYLALASDCKISGSKSASLEGATRTKLVRKTKETRTNARCSFSLYLQIILFVFFSFSGKIWDINGWCGFLHLHLSLWISIPFVLVYCTFIYL